MQGDQIYRFFTPKDYQGLLYKCLTTLDLKGPRKDPEAAPTDIDPENTLWGSREFFPKGKSAMEKVFPFPIFFKRQLKGEWDKPANGRQCPLPIKKLYNLPSFANAMLQVPRVDAPVLAIQSSRLVSEEDHGAIRDPWDKRLDTALKRCHEATAMAIKVCAMASIVSRASIVWGRKMVELLPESETHLLEGASWMLKTVSFMADATLDSLIFSSRAMASIVARRGIWLRAWQADIHSKQIVSAYPYKGGKLFGPHLDSILVDTRDKKKAMPRSLRKPDQRGSGPYSFRGSQSYLRGRSDYKRQSWNANKPQFKQPSFNPRAGHFPFSKGDKQDRDPKNQKA